MKNPLFGFPQGGWKVEWTLEKKMNFDWRLLEGFERSLDQGWTVGLKNPLFECFWIPFWTLLLFSFTISLVYCGSSLFFFLDFSLISGFLLQISDPFFYSSLLLISRLIRYLIFNFFHHLKHFVALEARENNLGR